MTQDQFMGILRQLLPFAAGIATGKGWLTMDQAAGLSGLILQIGGPLFLVGSGLWSFKANSKQSILLSAGQMPEVQKVIVTDPTLAATVPTSKVTT